MERIVQLIEKDALRLKALDGVQALTQITSTPYFLAAGFVRNMVWDALHQKKVATPLNDVDVIYFDDNETDSNTSKSIEKVLSLMIPELNWEVRNQAVMHTRNGDKPYSNLIDAMSYWPEKETAVAIRKTQSGSYESISAFGYESLFRLQVTHNPRRSFETFKDRMLAKKWLTKWPCLKPVFQGSNMNLD